MEKIKTVEDLLQEQKQISLKVEIHEKRIIAEKAKIEALKEERRKIGMALSLLTSPFQLNEIVIVSLRKNIGSMIKPIWEYNDIEVAIHSIFPRNRKDGLEFEYRCVHLKKDKSPSTRFVGSRYATLESSEIKKLEKVS
jgi:hypothetical protein